MTEQTNLTSQRKNGIDLFRLIAALFVLTLHNEYDKIPVQFAEGIQLSTRWAVPFFFVCTGYFLKNKVIDRKINFLNIQKNLVQLISLFIITTIIFTPFAILRYNLVFHILNLLIGVFYHLWFIGAMIFGYIFIWYIFYIGRASLLPWISGFLLIMNVVSSAYNVFFGIDLGSDTYGFLLSIPFMYLGMFLGGINLSKKMRPVLIALVIAGFLLQFLEADIIYGLTENNRPDLKLLLGTIILSISLFMLSATMDIRTNVFSTMGQKYSLFVYLYHPFAHALVALALSILPFAFARFAQVVNPILGLVVALFAAQILERYFKPLYKVLNGDFFKTQQSIDP